VLYALIRYISVHPKLSFIRTTYELRYVPVLVEFWEEGSSRHVANNFLQSCNGQSAIASRRTSNNIVAPRRLPFFFSISINTARLPLRAPSGLNESVLPARIASQFIGATHLLGRIPASGLELEWELCGGYGVFVALE